MQEVVNPTGDHELEKWLLVTGLRVIQKTQLPIAPTLASVPVKIEV